jgi:protein-L-isoaspartate(D-aspartate) O-methyltransferase
MAIDFAGERARMVAEQLEGRGITDTAVLQAMQTVPREKFVPDEFIFYAYDDGPLPIPANQTISQPYVVAFMIAAMGLRPSDKVLEIGSGSGYAAAVLSRIVAEVHTVERHGNLVQYARERLAALGYDNVHVHQGDGSLGWPEFAPYDGIIVAAGGPVAPPALKKQLAVNGRLVMPVGKRGSQTLVRLVRKNEDEFAQTKLGPVKFVPLIGAEGWQKG